MGFAGPPGRLTSEKRLMQGHQFFAEMRGSGYLPALEELYPTKLVHAGAEKYIERG